MSSVYDVSQQELIEKASEKLKPLKEIEPPKWSYFAKTGTHKERPPVRKDWWYVRSASILRKLYIQSPLGVNKLRTKYGGRKRRGVRQEEFRKASGNIIRKILQQLEKAELVKQKEINKHKGRTLTPKGKSFLDKIAAEMSKSMPKKAAPKKEEKKEKPKAVKPEVKKEEVKKKEEKSSKEEKKNG